jgi:putative ABC transport system ATP-binding protein
MNTTSGRSLHDNTVALVEARGVTKSYLPGKVVVQALRGIDLTIEHGEFIAIEGPSGSGKTTLLNLIGAIDTPTSGDILLKGRSLLGLRETELADIRRDHVGFIFQTFNLIPVLSALENVEFPLLIGGHDSHHWRAHRAQSLLEEVGLGDMIHRRPMELSGGQQQRVAIARALVKEPSLILADEPTANLDSDTSRDIMELMETMNRHKGVTFVFSTHDPRVLPFARRRITIRDGRLVEDRVTEPESA